MNTFAPPVVGPDVGNIPVILGGLTKVKSPDEVAVPRGVVTETVTEPAAWDLVVAVILVKLVTVNDVAGVVPNLTAEAPIRLVPVMVTLVPPVVGPVVGVSWVITGDPSNV